MDEQVVWVDRCMILEAAMASVARAFAAEFGPGGTGMWTVPLAPVGALAPTHFVSSGKIDRLIAEALDDPSQLRDVALSFGFDIALETCAGMLSAGHVYDISDGRSAWDCAAELGLVLFTGEVAPQQLQSRPLKDVLQEMLS